MRTDYSDKGFWLATYGPYEPNTPLIGDAQVDVAVIGGGFTGVTTAYYLRKSAPNLRVAVLESEVIGYGASGRNGSFAMTVVGLGIGVNAWLHGKEKTREAHHYMERAVDHIGELVEENNLDCDYQRVGFLRMATADGYVKRIRHDIELAHAWGITGIEWLDRDAARAQVNSDAYLGAWWEPRMALINPLKMVREMKRVAENLGAQVYEHTPVVEIKRDGKFVLKTPNGTVTAEKIVFATNGYSHLFPELRRKQIPAFTYMVATEPLTDAQLEPIGWNNRQGVEDARNLVHYYRLSSDRRLIMGGGPVGLAFGADMDRDADEGAWQHLRQHIDFLFPSLRGVKFEYRWGGPFSVTLDLLPAMGYLGDQRAVYALGCIGHGVSMMHLNAKVLADLLLERKSDLTDVCFVNRKVIAWPPEPLRLAASAAIRGYLQVEDWAYERGMGKK
jgi:glycine/D-amino acid oxidase-like deaminating enzyme